MDSDLHLDPGVRPRRSEALRGGRRTEVAPHLFRRVSTLEMKGRLLVKPEVRELFQRADRRAQRPIPRDDRLRPTETTGKKSTDLFGHRTMGRQLPAGDRDQAIAVLEDRVIPRYVRFGLRAAFTQQGTQARVCAHHILGTQVGGRERCIRGVQEIRDVSYIREHLIGTPRKSVAVLPTRAKSAHGRTNTTRPVLLAVNARCGPVPDSGTRTEDVNSFRGTN